MGAAARVASHGTVGTPTANWSRDILDGAFAEAMRARDEASKTSKT